MAIKHCITAIALAGAMATPAMAAPGDVLVKLRGTYTLRSGGDSFDARIGARDVRAKPVNSVGGEASLTFVVSEDIAVETAIGGSKLTLRDSGQDLASAGSFEPTVAVLYQPMGASGKLRPYAGLGVVYRKFYSEKAGDLIMSVIPARPGLVDISFSSQLAPVGKVGTDVAISDHSYVNVEARYSPMKTKVSMYNIAPSGIFADGHLKDLGLAVGMGFRF